MDISDCRLKMEKAGDLSLVRVENEAFDATILLQGAQLMQFAPRGQKTWLFESPHTPFAPGREIYGGIPVIFPWFGRLKPELNTVNHGFARSAQWRVESVSDDGSRVELHFDSDAASAQNIDVSDWPFPFAARMIFRFGESLGLRLEIENRGDQSMSFECALHTYFAVSNLETVRVEGLEGRAFGNLSKGKPQIQQGAIIFGAPVTQVFFGANDTFLVRDVARTLKVENTGARTTIVWNPGPPSPDSDNDLRGDDWKGFVCVENGAFGPDAVSLAAGERFALDVAISLLQ